MTETELFDEWPERYEDWFKTPIGGLVRKVEGNLVNEMVVPVPGELLLDAGCGTGIFTTDFLSAGCEVIGLDISRPMLRLANRKAGGSSFSAVQADMHRLPFQNDRFDKVVSITALEFIDNARDVIDEFFRVTRPGGFVVVATLNSLSPWATRRSAKTLRGEKHILENAHYRSAGDLLACCIYQGIARTAVYFDKADDVETAQKKEQQGREFGLQTGAFVAVKWQKPG